MSFKGDYYCDHCEKKISDYYGWGEINVRQREKRFHLCKSCSRILLKWLKIS